MCFVYLKKFVQEIKMEDKCMRKIKNYCRDLIEDKDDLNSNIEKVLCNITRQVTVLSEHCNSSLAEKELVLKYITKTMALFTELNHSVLKFLEDDLSFANPDICKQSRLSDENSKSKFNESLLSNFLKNDSQYHDDQRKCLENTVLKISFDENRHTYGKNGTLGNLDVLSSTVIENSVVPDRKCTKGITTNCTNDESKQFLPVSTNDCLLRNSGQIDCNLQEIEKIRENMKVLSTKLEFNDNTKNHSFQDVPNSSVNHEIPVNDLLTNKLSEDVIEKNVDEISTINNPCNDISNLEPVHEILNNNTEINQISILPKNTTGAIRKYSGTENYLTDSTAPSSAFSKVNIWLENSNPAITVGLNNCIEDNSVINKLVELKRRDEHKDDKLESLRFVPMEASDSIKNDLYSDVSSTKKKKSKKNKGLKNTNERHTLEPMQVPSKGTICTFAHIVSPSEFYLQIVSETNSKNLDLVTYNLNQTFKQTNSKYRTKREAFLALGNFCCGYVIEKKDWFRLSVINWKLEYESDNVEVQAVDYGYEHTISYKYLRELTQDLSQIPILAIKCHFPLLYPPGSTVSNKITEWPSVSIEGLDNIANLPVDNTKSEYNFFEIIFSMPQGDSVAVDLIQHNGDGTSLGALLVEFDLGVEIGDEPNQYVDDMNLDMFLADTDKMETANNLNELVWGYDPTDEARICKFSRPDGTCFKGANCKLDHVLLKDGYTTDKVEVFNTTKKEMVLPKKGEIRQILVTAFVDPCTYIVQIVNDPVNDESIGAKVDKELSNLIDFMNKPRTISNYDGFKLYPSLGELVVVYSKSLDLWVRARVLDFEDFRDSIKVSNFVQFGASSS